MAADWGTMVGVAGSAAASEVEATVDRISSADHAAAVVPSAAMDRAAKGKAGLAIPDYSPDCRKRS